MKVISIRLRGIMKEIDIYKDLLREEKISLSSYYIEQNFEKDFTEVNLVILVRAHRNLLPVINRLGEARPTLSITLSNQIDL